MENILDDFEAHNGLSTQEKWFAFIGKGQQDYVKNWKDIERGNIISFNFPAFLVGLLWMCYRKMYLEVGIFVGLMALEIFILDFIIVDYNPAISTYLNLTYAVLLGIFGNWLYYKSAQRKIKAIEEQNLDETQVMLALKQKGGVSPVAVLIAIGCSILFTLLVSGLIL